MSKQISQSQINRLAQQSDIEQSHLKESQIQCRSKHNQKQQSLRGQQSNQYNQQQFQQFEQSRRTNKLNNNFKNITKEAKGQKSSIYDSYGGQQFESYEESRRTKQFQRSQPNLKIVKKQQQQGQLMPIKQYPSDKKQSGQKIKKQSPSQTAAEASFRKTNLIKLSSEQKQKLKVALVNSSKNNTNNKSQKNEFNKTEAPKINNSPFNYNRLQQREKQLMFTTICEENKKLKQIICQKDKELVATKTKYTILIEEKAKTLEYAKQAAIKKKLQQLQKKYDELLKQKAKQRAYKTVTTGMMPKTMANNFVSEAQAHEREVQLMNIIEKLKQRLVATDKQLKTLQQKMNEGLDFQQQLQRKLKRVQQLEFRLQNMKLQAQDDRILIQSLKQKSKEQKKKIEQLQQQKNQLRICLKRAEMNQATQSDIASELEQTRKQKEMLEKSLKQISLNFTSKLLSAGNSVKMPPKSGLQNIEDSNEFINFKG